MTVSIEIINDGALRLLSELERLNLIRLNILADNAVASETEKLSAHFAGALQLSDAAYDAFQKNLQEGRNEWARDIC